MAIKQNTFIKETHNLGNICNRKTSFFSIQWQYKGDRCLKISRSKSKSLCLIGLTCCHSSSALASSGTLFPSLLHSPPSFSSFMGAFGSRKMLTNCQSEMFYCNCLLISFISLFSRRSKGAHLLSECSNFSTIYKILLRSSLKLFF